jgi:phage tail-like protein
MAEEIIKADPYVSFRFKIECKGVISGGFSECSGLQVETEVEEYREGGNNEYIHKLPKSTKYGAITLKRGMIDSVDLWKWCRNVFPFKEGEPKKRKNLSIILLDSLGNETNRWNITEALPVKWSSSEFKADTGAVLVETLEIVHHGFTFEKSTQKKE